MKKLYLFLFASILGLVSLSAQTREALEDSVVVGGISRPLVDKLMDLGKMDNEDKLVAHWRYAELMEDVSREHLASFSDQELRDVLAFYRTDAYGYFTSSLFLQTFVENVNKALQYELGEDLRFSYTLNDRTYGAGLEPVYKYILSMIRPLINDMLSIDGKWITNAKASGIPSVHIELMKTSARSVEANLFNIFKLSALDYLTREQLKAVVDFSRTPVWKTYLEYTAKVKAAADLTSAEFVEGFKAGLKDVKITNTQQRTSVAEYVSLSRSFPEFIPEFQRPYAEMTVGTAKYEGQVKNMLPHGKGKMTDKRGTVYEGYFMNGLKHGIIKVSKPGKPSVVQYWIDDKYRKDIPVAADADGTLAEPYKYEGKYYGYGQLYDVEKKTSYQGMFIDGNLNGEAVVIEAGRRLEGEFADGNLIDGVIYWTRDNSQTVSFNGKTAARASNGVREWVAKDNSRHEVQSGAFTDDILDGAGSRSTESNTEKNESSGLYAYGKLYGMGYLKRVIEKNNHGIHESSVYQGYLYADRYHGEGRLTYTLKNIPDGYGPLVCSSVELPGTTRETLEVVLEGVFDDGVFKEGRITYSDGSWYDGKFAGEGLVKGTMRRKYDDGSIYVGDCVNGKRHGFGELRSLDGKVFKGQFEFDEPVLVPEPEQKKPKPARRMDELNYVYDHITAGPGKATMIKPAGVIFMVRSSVKSLKVVCKGLFLYDTLLEGKVTLSDGCWLEGVFEDGVLMQGKGKTIDKYHTVYEGEIKNGYPHGKGRCYYTDGTWFKGNFAWGNRMDGTHYSADGKVIKVYEL